LLGEVRLFQHVDHEQLILTAKILLADSSQVLDRPLGARRLTGDVELENKFTRHRFASPLNGPDMPLPPLPYIWYHR